MITVTMSGKAPRGIDRKVLEKTVREVFRAARRKARGEVSVRFVSDREIAALNRRFLGNARPTDVLSFATPNSQLLTSDFHFPSSPPDWGDILIAPAYARRETERRGIDMKEEIIRLVAHGMLHLLGMDHDTPSKEARLFALQEAVVDKIV